MFCGNKALILKQLLNGNLGVRRKFSCLIILIMFCGNLNIDQGVSGSIKINDTLNTVLRDASCVPNEIKNAFISTDKISST